MLLDAQKYNHAYVTKIYNLMIWDNSEKILSKPIINLADKRADAKEIDKKTGKMKNKVLAEVLKLLMNGANGKFSQKIHDKKAVIMSDPAEIDDIYQNSKEVLRDITLANDDQCLVEYKIGLQDVQFPVYLNAFVLSYAHRRMNMILAMCDGFTNWDNTFFYADTDSLFLHHRVGEILRKKDPDLFGKKLGQLHNDVEEVEDGIVIGAIFVAPKLYILEVFGISKKTGLYTVEYHVRGKGVRGIGKKLTFEKFEKMLFNNDHVSTDEWHFASNIWDSSVPAITRFDNQKITNKKPWIGRMPWDPKTNRRLPFSTSEQREQTNIWAEKIRDENQKKIDRLR